MLLRRVELDLLAVLRQPTRSSTASDMFGSPFRDDMATQPADKHTIPTNGMTPFVRVGGSARPTFLFLNLEFRFAPLMIPVKCQFIIHKVCRLNWRTLRGRPSPPIKRQWFFAQVVPGQRTRGGTWDYSAVIYVSIFCSCRRRVKAKASLPFIRPRTNR